MTERVTKREQTYQRILGAAGREFRSNGYAGIGVDGVAKAAGVTSGAFYAHFGSKDGAFIAALEAGLNEVINAVPIFQKENGPSWVQAFASYYLGKPHRDDLACGCAMTTLSPEIARSSPELHSVYEEKMNQIVALIVRGLVGDSEKDKTARAWSMLSTLIGGLTVSRAVHDHATAEIIAKTAQSSAIAVAGPTK